MKKEINEYIAYDKYKYQFYFTVFLFMSMNIFYYFKPQFTFDTSIRLVIYLRNSQSKFLNQILEIFSYLFTEVLLSILIFFIFIVFTLRRNYENSLSMFFGFTMIIYVDALMKMIWRDPKINFLSIELESCECQCDYGMASSQTSMITAILLFLYYDLKQSGLKNRTAFKSGIAVIIFLTVIAQLYLGHNSIYQILMGIVIGLMIFFASRKYNDDINKKLIWPIFYKDRFNEQQAIFTLLSLAMILNYTMFFLWGLNYTTYETQSNMIPNQQTCHFCTDKENISTNFSTQIFKQSLLFNVGCGLLLGVYLSKKKIFTYQGLYADKNRLKYALRLLIFFVFLSPIVIIYLIPSNNSFFLFLAFLFPMTIGVFLNTFFFVVLKHFNLKIKKIDEDDIQKQLEALDVSNTNESGQSDLNSEQTGGDISFD